MSAVPVPDRIAMCAAPHGEHDYWALAEGEEAVSCLHGECECDPVVFVRERDGGEVSLSPSELHSAELAVGAELDQLRDNGEGHLPYARSLAAIGERVAAALDQGEGERP